MDELAELIGALPLPALVVFAVVLAVIVGVRYLGLWQGRNASPAASSGAAQVAAVIVDPTALQHLTGAVDGMTVAITENNVIAKRHSDATERLARSVEELHDGVDSLKNEVIRSAARMK